jgi:hypothetical protein
MQQQQHANYDLLAVFSDEARAEAAVAKLRKEGFHEEEIHQLVEGSVGTGQFREHGPNQARGAYFLQTRRASPSPAIVIFLALVFAIILGVLSFAAGFAFPRLPEPVTVIVGALVGLILGALIGLLRRGRVRGNIGQSVAAQPNAPPSAKSDAKTIVAMRFEDPDNISRNSRARAILINNQGKIDRSVGRKP